MLFVNINEHHYLCNIPIRTIDKKYSHPSPKADYDADAMTNDY